MFGTIAAAAAAAKLRRLDAERAGHAVGLAASMAAGVAANFGSMAKPFHAGRAAQNGVLAARLAAAGMTAAPDAIEHASGFLHAFSPRGDVDLDREPTLGREWTLLRYGLNVKRYPVAYCCQRGLDAMFSLLAEHAVQGDQVRRIRALMSPTEAGILKHHRPQTALEAKFSIEFALAGAILAGRVGLRELTDEFVRRPDVQELLRRVHVETTDDADPDMPTFARFEQVTVELADGTPIASPKVYQARGSARQPLDRVELWEKFRDCAGDRLAEAEARRLFDRLQHLERTGSVAEVVRAPGPPGRAVAEVTAASGRSASRGSSPPTTHRRSRFCPASTRWIGTRRSHWRPTVPIGSAPTTTGNRRTSRWRRSPRPDDTAAPIPTADRQPI